MSECGWCASEWEVAISLREGDDILCCKKHAPMAMSKLEKILARGD